MKTKMTALPASSLPGPENITETSLSNGIKVMVRENFNSPSVVLGGHLPCGALFDPKEKLGLADFTALGLMRGTAQRSFQQIYEALESNAASLGFGGGMHTIGFNGRALAEDLPLLLDLLRESLLEPIFPVEEIERLRAQLMTGLALRAQDTGEMAALTFDQLLFREHPYAQPEDGWLETVAAITRDDLLNFHREHFGPGGMVLAAGRRSGSGESHRPGGESPRRLEQSPTACAARTASLPDPAKKHPAQGDHPGQSPERHCHGQQRTDAEIPGFPAGFPGQLRPGSIWIGGAHRGRRCGRNPGWHIMPIRC